MTFPVSIQNENQIEEGETRLFSLFASLVFEMLRVVRSKLDFIFVWELERRMRPFGPLEWTRLSAPLLEALASSSARKSELLARLARELPIDSPALSNSSFLSSIASSSSSSVSSSSSASSVSSSFSSSLVSPLPRGHVHAFAARVDSAGGFFPLPPIAALSNRMFRVYGPHRFLRVHYDDPLPKHLRLQALNVCGRRWELLYCDLAKRTIVYFAVKGSGLTKEVPVETVREWHIPLSEQENLDMTLAKYNARFSLAFSDSLPTACFDQMANVLGLRKRWLLFIFFF